MDSSVIAAVELAAVYRRVLPTIADANSISADPTREALMMLSMSAISRFITPG